MLRASREPSRSVQGESLFGALIRPASVAASSERNFARRFSEITACRRLRSVQSATEINAVQIQLHDFLFAEFFLDATGEKNFEQFSAESSLLERETIARQLLRDCASTLAHVTSGDVLQRRSHNPKQVVAAVLIKLVVFNRDDRVDQIGWQLLVGNGLAILHVDLAEDLIVSIHNHAGRFHIFKLAQIVGCSLAIEVVRCGKSKNDARYDENDGKADGDVEVRPCVPRWPKAIERASREIRNRHAVEKTNRLSRAT